jgi:hypothetical protein
MPLSGKCRCGAVGYEIALDDLPLSYACHCRDCQTWSGSAFAVHSMISEPLLKIASEAVRFQLAGLESTAPEHIGCATCFTRIANSNSAVPGLLILRAGTLDRSDEIVPVVHIWTKRKQPWIAIPDDIPIFEESPSPEAFAATIA